LAFSAGALIALAAIALVVVVLVAIQLKKSPQKKLWN